MCIRENGTPMIGPANFMNPGQRSPSSNESTVPETAPTANRIATPLAHCLASSRYSGSPVRSHRHSASTIIRGIPIPISANTMWKPREIAICERAASRSVTLYAHLLAGAGQLGAASSHAEDLTVHSESCTYRQNAEAGSQIHDARRNPHDQSGQLLICEWLAEHARPRKKNNPAGFAGLLNTVQ